MEKIRKIGIGFLTLGLALSVGSWVMVEVGIGPAAFFGLVGPPMILISAVMIIAPGDAHGAHDIDFVDWFDDLPGARRAALYLLGVVGLGIGVVLLLEHAGWSIEGILSLLG